SLRSPAPRQVLRGPAKSACDLRQVHILQHVARDGPGRIADIAKAMGLDVVVYSLFDGARAPSALVRDDLLVVMGGPMSVADAGDPRWPFLEAEIGLLGRRTREGAPVLGVCLGAQLMAHALGARVYPLRVGEPPSLHREVGWGPVAFVAGAGDEPALAGMSDSEIVLHWHGDTFDLPEGATLLASTPACRQQMFRFGPRAFGLQFHVEVTAADVAHWVREDAAFVRAANGTGGADRLLGDTARCMPRYRESSDRMIRNLLGAMLAPGE
ncbi:MAG: type 1 glutamine amidotransferase, partial [Polyangiaceae bacterium]